MLALNAAELRTTDCADHAIDALTSDAVKEILILGRRGPAQAAFTNPELLELGELELADVIVDPADLELDEASQAWLDSDQADKTSRENVRILREYAAREPAGKPKRIVLRFLTSPVELQGDERVERIVVERNRLEPRDDGSLAARGTGERETLDCGLVLRSIGYKGIGIPEVPFDERRGTIPNVAGRVVDGEHHVTGEYVTGWIRRGPSGVIGTNKKDGQEAASSLLEDAEAGLLNQPDSDGDIVDLLVERGVEPISWEGWERIDAHEQNLGGGTRPRVKLTRYELLHGAARGQK
jgi:ferredoxin--NADP+ reductase